MNARNKFLILLGIIVAIATGYYFFSTPSGNDLVLVGTVDANQIVVSPQIQGRIAKLLVEEGTQVKQGDLIALLDPSELEAEERAAAATISSMRSQMNANEYTRQSTKGSTSSDVSNAQAKLQSARAQLAQAEAMLTRVESDSRRTIGLAEAGVASEQEKVQAEMNLKAQQASVQSLKDQVTAAQADLNAAIARTNQATAAQSTVLSTRAQVANAEAQLKEAEVRLGYTKIYAPVTGTVLVRAAREGEVVNAGAGDRDGGGFQRHVGAGGDSGDGCGSHWLWRHSAGATAGRDDSAGQSFLQGGGGGVCDAAGCGAAEARYSHDCAKGAAGESEGRVRAGDDGGGAGVGGAIEGDGCQEGAGGRESEDVESCRALPGWTAEDGRPHVNTGDQEWM